MRFLDEPDVITAMDCAADAVARILEATFTTIPHALLDAHRAIIRDCIAAAVQGQDPLTFRAPVDVPRRLPALAIPRAPERSDILLRCGHAPHGRDATDHLVCLICATPDGRAPAVPQPVLGGRLARCYYCTTTAPSAPSLPLFHYRRAESLDRFYCGCKGRGR